MSGGRIERPGKPDVGAPGRSTGRVALSIRDHDEAVRERAYYLWEKAGCPCGREHEFWARASLEIEGEEADARSERERIVAR